MTERGQSDAPPIAPIAREQIDHAATVLICTYNRADYLGATLDSLAQTRPTTFDWKVLVVDNNSSDGTRTVVEARIPHYPVPLGYLFEARQGKSHALNTGITAARASIIVFTDDDVKVPGHWLDSAVRPLIDRTDVDYTGGPVRPIWTAPRPAWLDIEGNLGGVIAVKDHGALPFIFEDARKTPLGVNMAVRRSVFERVGGFRPDLGRNGGSLLGQEQAEFFYRTRAAGVRGLYVPGMVLDHLVASGRLTERYFRRWWYWKGVSHARVHQIHGRTELGIDLRDTPHLLGIPRFILGNASRSAMRLVKAALHRDTAGRVRHWLSLAYYLGYVREARAIRHRRADSNGLGDRNRPAPGSFWTTDVASASARPDVPRRGSLEHPR